MALIRCPIHKIPYNDENPRGCPACAKQKDGATEAEVMQELARASRAARGLPPEGPVPGRRPSGALGIEAQPVSAQPHVPELVEGRAGRLMRQLRERRALTTGAALILGLVCVLLLTSGPRFIEAPSPPVVSADPLPLPIEPSGPITNVFAVLGNQTPQAVPDAPQLARYSYGTALHVDAFNGIVYAITVSLPNRSWRGLTVGAPEQRIRGLLALLGLAREESPATQPQAQMMGGYMVFPSLELRPQRVLTVEVRPPNGCYDVTVVLQPRAAGVLLRGQQRYAAIGKGEVAFQWVATSIRIVNRALSGPYETNARC